MTNPVGEDTRQSIHELIEALRRDRQRLQVQVNLGQKELRDEWSGVEEKWHEIEHRLTDVSDKSMRRITHLVQEVGETYGALKKRFGS
ncbi:MAG: hypothetical protein AAF993_10890 [Pseudomonadota bacterium]